MIAQPGDPNGKVKTVVIVLDDPWATFESTTHYVKEEIRKSLEPYIGDRTSTVTKKQIIDTITNNYNSILSPNSATKVEIGSIEVDTINLNIKISIP